MPGLSLVVAYSIVQAMKQDINMALNCGFKDYITKPFDILGFFAKIDKKSWGCTR